MINKKDTYAVVNEEGEILEKFRVMSTALGAMPRLKSHKHEKLKVIRLLPICRLRLPKSPPHF